MTDTTASAQIPNDALVLTIARATEAWEAQIVELNGKIDEAVALFIAKKKKGFWRKRDFTPFEAHLKMYASGGNWEYTSHCRERRDMRNQINRFAAIAEMVKNENVKEFRFPESDLKLLKAYL